MKYLLDTNILSEPLKPEPDSALMRRLEAHGAELAAASVVIHELLFGCRPPSAAICLKTI